MDWKLLRERGEAAIHDLFHQQVAEGQRLEFKRKSQPDRAALNTDDKKGLGESLSALSNAEGGIILFGIAGERGEDGLDYAKEAQPLVDPRAFAAKVLSLIPEYLTPPNPDIEVCAIPLSGGGGVVAVRVGSSDRRPHMSMAPDHRKYFLRVHATNQPMVDFQIRDMMRVNTTPHLMLGYQLRPGPGSPDKNDSEFVLTLINEGRVSAYQPYIVVRRGTTLHSARPGSLHFEFFQLADEAERGFQGTGRLALHLGHEVPAVTLLFRVKRVEGEVCLRLDSSTKDYVLWRRCPPVTISVAIGAEHCPAREIEFTIAQDELEAMAERVMNARRIYRGTRTF